MPLFSALSFKLDVDRSPHASFSLLVLLTLFVAASDFLIFLPFQFGLQQLLHLVAIVLPLLFWGLLLKFHNRLLQKIIPIIVFLLLFALWSWQLYLNTPINLLFIAGLMLLLIWQSVQSRFQFWLSLVTSLTMLVLLQLFSSLSLTVFSVYVLLLVAASAMGWFALTYGRPALATRQPLSGSDYLPESVDVQHEATVQPVSDLEADIAMVHVDADSRPSWEQALRELHNELKTTADIDSLFKKMLLFISGVMDIEAAAVGMIQDRSLNRITQYGPEELVHAKVLAWNNERIKTLIQTQHATVNQQDHFRDRGSSIKLYRIDIPVISSSKTVGIVTLFRTSFLFDEYEVSLASSIVFHSMVALRQARLQEEIKRLSSSNNSKTVYTREQFVEKARHELAQLDKPRSFSLLIIEIDNYDDISDKNGRDTAAKLYKSVASSIMGNLRQNDVMGNYGKEGFIVLLHEADLLESKKIAELIRSRVSQVKCKIADGVITTTLSIGLTTVSEQGEDMASLIRKADMGLFVAKESGRNSVKVSL
jgi:diguanylate cyclase (GGDEF)-like protein